MRKQKSPPSEHAIQVAIVKYLTWALSGEMDFFSVANSPRSKVSGFLEKQRGAVAGVADLVIYGLRGDGSAFIGFMEIKKEGGRQAPKQKEFEKRAKECGAEYAICRSLEDARETLEDWQIL